MSEQSKERPRATIAQAKAAWEAHPDPSIRTVVAALKEAGLVCSISTLQRWHKAEWALRRDVEANKRTTAEEASAKVGENVKKIEEKALSRIEMFEAEEAAMKKLAADLDVIESDSELSRKAMRKSLIAQIVLSEQIIRRAALLVELAPGKVASIMEALKGPAASTTIVIPQDNAPQGHNGDGARVIDGRVIEDSPVASAITAFKQRQKQGVPA